jgi:hypothetical protein
VLLRLELLLQRDRLRLKAAVMLRSRGFLLIASKVWA